jgi:hypothetical protein
MQDYIPLGNNAFSEIYQIKPHSKYVFIDVDLRWPEYNLDHRYSRYFLSWHTEQLDTQWLLKQADLVYPKPIMVAYDTDVINDYYPDNVQFVKWNTWGLQLELASSYVGINNNPTLPKYKFSSLSFRYSQYKKFITAFLLSNIDNSDMILSWHGTIGKDEDLHDHPKGLAHLDNLNFNLSKTILNFNDDEYSWSKNRPMSNVNWKLDPGYNALVTLTNESFHYSNTIINGIETRFPGPYITEKTFKPLLAGRPFVAVGQCNTLKFLDRLGFQTNFGWDNSYDEDCGDLTRIGKIFNTITEINNATIDDLYEQSLPAVQHNLNHIKSGHLNEVCNSINAPSQQVIKDFVS